jgi:tetratricopeptide (TPR) repeat protein
MGLDTLASEIKTYMKNWTWILLILMFGACGQKSELSVENGSREFCDCFISQTSGTVDERLSPCLQKIADRKNDEWNDSEIIDSDSIKVKLSEFNLDVMLDMIRTCDNYFNAINDLYDKGYPIDTTRLNRDAIRDLSTRIKTETNKDSLKSLLHKKSYKLIRSREFDRALQTLDSIKSLDNSDYNSSLASAYIFNQQGLHDKAVNEIERAIELSDNQNLQLYAEIARQKKRTSKK